MDLLAEHGDTPEFPIPVAIETFHGLLVSCLCTTGRPVYAINPLTAARYRGRYALTRKKSDHLTKAIDMPSCSARAAASAVAGSFARRHL